MLQNWFKTFVYHFKNSKAFSLLTIIGLALGISGVIFAVLYWDDEHSYDAWNPNKDRYHQVIFDMSDGDVWATAPAPLAPLLKSKLSEIEDYTYTTNWYSSGTAENEDKKVYSNKVLTVDSTFFRFMPFEFISGNSKTALKQKNSIVLSVKTAKTLFGDTDPVGSFVNFDAKAYQVTGVYTPNKKSSFNPDFVVNTILTRLENDKDNWGNYNFALFLKLKKDADLAKVKKTIDEVIIQENDMRFAKMEGISLEEYQERYGKTSSVLKSLSDLRLHSIGETLPEGRGNYQMLLITLGLSLLILVLSIVNYINLSTANAIKRAKEVGVRKIVGASKRQVILQLMFETSLYLIVAFLLAFSIVELGLPYFNDFLQKSLEWKIIRFLPNIVSIFLIVLLLAGLLPALYVANFETLQVLKGNFSRSKSGIWLRNGMLVLQFVIASMFIVGAYIVRQQVHFMNTKDLGYNGSQVVMIQYLPQNQEGNNYDKYQILKSEIKKINGVKDVSAGAFKIGDGAININGFEREPDKKLIRLYVMTIDVNFLEMMDIKLLEGRKLSDELATDTITSVLLNKKAVAEYQLDTSKPIIGAEIPAWNKRNVIVGIVDDFNFLGFHSDIPPMIFSHFKITPWMHHNLQYVYVKIDSEQTESVLTKLEEHWKENVNSNQPFSYDFVDKSFAQTYQQYTNQNKIFSILNIVVVCIALFGLFALASYSMERRMKEIAIRKTLGASVQTLLKNLTLQYVIFCVIGFALSVVPTYLLLQKWLENFAYRIDISFIPFVVGFLSLMVLTLLIVLIKAHQATRVDVLKYLKYE
jgi:putative ABC transport system permease protein